MNDDAARLVRELNLQPHPEGGFYRETYRTENPGGRAGMSSIYFLLPYGSLSSMHRIDADEAWHHYAGDDIAVELIAENGERERRVIGRAGPWQTIVRRGAWFAAEPLKGGAGFALVGCDVAPAFSFAGFELAKRATLSGAYPQHAELIRKFTRDA